MFKKLLSILLLTVSITASAKKPKNTYVSIKTGKGECIVKLYNETPKHRDNFIKLVKEGYYNGTLFHRVIKGFMVQGGDPKSKTAVARQELGNGDLGYKIDAELRDSLFHLKGALAAARDDNPAKASSSCQFYIVQGKVFTDEELNMIEQQRLNGRKIPVWQRQVYKKTGGSPFLDQNYTVFGYVVRGIDLIDSIAGVEKDLNNRPKEDIKMEVSILKKRTVKKLEKELLQEAFKRKLIMDSGK